MTRKSLRKQPSYGFTLVELLLVVALIGILLGLLAPAIGRARASGEAAQCASNLRQLYMANVLYAADNGCYVAAAPDIFFANLHRWHGARDSTSEPFDFSRSPLAPYLGGDGRLKACPGFRRYRSDQAANAFEASCGGYGYNYVGVGSRCYLLGYNPDGVARGMPPGMIRDPAGTIMFADCAFPQPYGKPEYLIEYSFAEPYRFVDGEGNESPQRPLPSLHFRHNGAANVVWCDGHVSREKMAFSCDDQFRRLEVGWFGGRDNALFDPY